jgi:dipeptidase
MKLFIVLSLFCRVFGFLAPKIRDDITAIVNDGHCTTVAVGRKAMADESTVTTHNVDCQECDMRVNHVPARDWAHGSKRPIFDLRGAYPRALETPEDNIHGPSYLVGTEDSTIYPWKPMTPMMYIDQVSC